MVWYSCVTKCGIPAGEMHHIFWCGTNIQVKLHLNMAAMCTLAIFDCLLTQHQPGLGILIADVWQVFVPETC